MDSRQARQLAERSFNQEARERVARTAITEYEAEARATREKTARLKALRLAKEAEAKTEKPADASGKFTQRRPPRRDK